MDNDKEVLAELKVLTEVNREGFKDMSKEFKDFKETVNSRFVPIESFINSTKGALTILGALLGSGIVFSTIGILLAILI